MVARLEQRLRLHQLRAVAAIAGQGSLLRASRALGISQPALSRTLHEVEADLGTPLFVRQPRGVCLTDAGSAVLLVAQRVLSELGRLEEELAHIASGAGGRVAVGALPVAAAGLLPGALTLFRARHPDLAVKLVQGATERLLPELVSGGLDLMVGRLYAPPVPDGLMRLPLYAEPISVLTRADHPIFALPRVSVAELLRFNLVLPTVSQRVGQEIDRMLAIIGLRPGGAMRASSTSFVREMLLATDDITVVPRLMMAGDLLRGALRVVKLPLSAAVPPRPAGLILRADGIVPPAARALVAALRDHIVELAAHEIVHAEKEVDIPTGYMSA